MRLAIFPYLGNFDVGARVVLCRHRVAIVVLEIVVIGATACHTEPEVICGESVTQRSLGLPQEVPFILLDSPAIGLGITPDRDNALIRSGGFIGDGLTL